MKSFQDLTILGSLVLLVEKTNIFWNFFLGHSTIIAQCRLHLRRQGEQLLVSNGSQIWVVVTILLGGNIPLFLAGFSVILLLLIPIIMIGGNMVYLNVIKFTFHLMPGTPPPVRSTTSNIFLIIIDYSILNIFKDLRITLTRFFSYSIGTFMFRWMISVFNLLLCNFVDFI